MSSNFPCFIIFLSMYSPPAFPRFVSAFTATFEGEATYEPDQQQKSGKVEGKAIDKRGGS